MADDRDEDLGQRFLVGDLEQHAVQPVTLALTALEVDHELADLDRCRQLMADVVERGGRQQVRLGDALGQMQLEAADHGGPGRQRDVDEVGDQRADLRMRRRMGSGGSMSFEAAVRVGGRVRREDLDDRLGGAGRFDDALERGIDDDVHAELALDRGRHRVDRRELPILADELALGRLDGPEHDVREHDHPDDGQGREREMTAGVAAAALDEHEAEGLERQDERDREDDAQPAETRDLTTDEGTRFDLHGGMVGPGRAPGEGWSGPSGRAIGHPERTIFGGILREITGRPVIIAGVLSSAPKRRGAMDRDDDSSLSSQIVGPPAFGCPGRRLTRSGPGPTLPP